MLKTRNRSLRKVEFPDGFKRSLRENRTALCGKLVSELKKRLPEVVQVFSIYTYSLVRRPEMPNLAKFCLWRLRWIMFN